MPASLFLLSQPVSGQSGLSKVGVPSMGFVYDGSQSAIRPILGLPGAAIVGAPLDPGFAVARAAVAAQRQFVLAASGDDGRARVIVVQDSGLTVRPVDGALISPDRMILSPSATSAILYRRDAARLQIVTGLPEAPVVAREIALDDSGSAHALAVSDDGALALYAAGAGPLWLFDSNGGRAQLSLPAAVAAVTFRPGGSDALAVVRTGELYMIQADGGTAYYGRIAGDDPSDPVAVQLSRDGARAYVAYAGGSIAVFDSAAGVSKTVSCECSPTGLEPVNSAMFRVNDGSSGPVMLYDGSGADPRVWFVPVDRTQGNAQ